MSQETTVEAAQTLPLEALTYFELDNGALCFIGNVDDICKHVDALGFQIYYVMTEGKFSKKTGTTTTYESRPAVFKIVNNLIGRAVVPADDEIKFSVVSPTAWFGLPKIPYLLVKKMDSFFRTVHDMYGTESIVILTFDPTYADTDDPSAGWGILVPDQENTAGNCDYVADSIVDDKPDHVIIVGSAHSHPQMSAFASGTDHKDQATFDGLHITYGWMKSKDGGATEYHIELQMGGKIFGMDPEQVFGDIPQDAPDEEIKSWTDKVKKKTYANTSHGSGGPGKFPGSQHSTQGTYNHASPSERWKTRLPSGHPPIDKSVFIAILSGVENESCPFCDTSILKQDISKRRCLACHQFIALPGETLEDVLKVRIAEKVYAYEIDTAKNPPKAIYYWLPKQQGEQFIKIYDPAEGLVGELGK